MKRFLNLKIFANIAMFEANLQILKQINEK